MVVLDTSAIIDVSRGNSRAVAAVRKARQEGEAMTASAITVFELAAGTPAGLGEKMRELLKAVDVIAFGPAQAEAAAAAYAELRGKGEDIGVLDAMIAGTALSAKQTLITGNAKHFKRVRGLETITY